MRCNMNMYIGDKLFEIYLEKEGEHITLKSEHAEVIQTLAVTQVR